MWRWRRGRILFASGCRSGGSGAEFVQNLASDAFQALEGRFAEANNVDRFCREHENAAWLHSLVFHEGRERSHFRGAPIADVVFVFRTVQLLLKVLSGGTDHHRGTIRNEVANDFPGGLGFEVFNHVQEHHRVVALQVPVEVFDSSDENLRVQVWDVGPEVIRIRFDGIDNQPALLRERFGGVGADIGGNTAVLVEKPAVFAKALANIEDAMRVQLGNNVGDCFDLGEKAACYDRRLRRT